MVCWCPNMVLIQLFRHDKQAVKCSSPVCFEIGMTRWSISTMRSINTYIYLYLLIYLFFYPFIWHRFHGWASIFLSAILALRNPGDFDGSLPSLWLLKNKKSNVKTKRKGFKTVTWPKQPLLEKGRRQKKC